VIEQVQDQKFIFLAYEVLSETEIFFVPMIGDLAEQIVWYMFPRSAGII